MQRWGRLARLGTCYGRAPPQGMVGWPVLVDTLGYEGMEPPKYTSRLFPTSARGWLCPRTVCWPCRDLGVGLWLVV